jgi:GH24 family phage-related lysozyme (muramidase)
MTPLGRIAWQYHLPQQQGQQAPKKGGGGGGLGGLMGVLGGIIGNAAPSIGGALGSGVIDEAVAGASAGIDSSTHIPNFTGPGMSPVFGESGFIRPAPTQAAPDAQGALFNNAVSGGADHLGRPANGHPYAIAQPVQAQANGHPYATGLGVGSQIPSSLAKVAAAANPPAVGGDWVTRVKKFEGYYPKAYWDYKQHSVGWGTRARYPGERITKAEAERRLQSELGAARAIVDRHAPNAPEGIKNALTSLTFNAGSKWTRSGLGRLVAKGDYQGALQRFLQYNRAGGKVNRGLVNRRNAEAKWWNY